MKPLCATIIFIVLAVVLTPAGSPLWWQLTARAGLVLWALWLQGKMLKA